MAPGQSAHAAMVWGGRASPVRPAHAPSPERLLRNPGALGPHCAPGIPELINSGICARGACRPGRAHTLRWRGRTGITCVLRACSGSRRVGLLLCTRDSGVDQLRNSRQGRMPPGESAHATMVWGGRASPVRPANALSPERLLRNPGALGFHRAPGIPELINSGICATGASRSVAGRRVNARVLT